MKLQKLTHIIIPLVCFGVLSATQAVVPPPDGDYPGRNTAEGQKALFSLTSGTDNTALGYLSLQALTTGNLNTGVGAWTLALNTADENTATGTAALFLNTSGSGNTANGTFALLFNGTGAANTASGDRALFSNTEGNFNTASGFFALHDNTGGIGNTATGASALQHNTTGGLNAAIGGNTLMNNTEGTENTATGFNALSSNIDGSQNTATGASALSGNATGTENTATGFEALLGNNASQNTAIGVSALRNNTSGSVNTALGRLAGANATTGDLNVYIGAGMLGVAGESHACYIASIFGRTSVGGMPVIINSDNKLGTTVSSKRFKEAIKPMDKASELLFALEPVAFRYKNEIDPAGTPQLGLVAEDVEKVNPDLVVRDKEGKPYSVRYDQVNAMLLNEVLKEHKRVQEQECRIQEQQTTIAQLKDHFEMVSAQQQKEMQLLRQQLNRQSAQIQRVTADLEMRDSVPASQVVVNRP